MYPDETGESCSENPGPTYYRPRRREDEVKSMRCEPPPPAAASGEMAFPTGVCTLEAKSRFASAKQVERWEKKKQYREAVRAVAEEAEARACRANEFKSDGFNFTFCKGRRQDAHDRDAYDARKNAEVARSAGRFEPVRCEDDGRAAHGAPFRVGAPRKIKPFELAQIEARERAEFGRQHCPEGLVIADPDPARGRRPDWSKKPASKAPKGDVLAAIEARQEADLRRKYEAIFHDHGSHQPAPSEAPWVGHFAKGPSQFDLQAAAAKAEKDQDLKLQEADHRRKFAFFYDDRIQW